ncbi:MAG: response regulator [Pseudomonadales bacterium]|nr:response regulator [Pseudomonadales bacterium]
MNVFCVDDDDFHRSKIRQCVEKACTIKGIDDCVIIECADGDEFLEKVKAKVPSLITLDITMPKKDGLSTLVRYRHLNPSVKILIVSSENARVVRRLSTKKYFSTDESKKQELLAKVIERVKTDNIEPGKLNSVLEAVSNLGLDPIQVAKECGATGFLRKPYDMDSTANDISLMI